LNIRRLTEDDKPILKSMIAWDMDHTAKALQPEFFYAHGLCLCFEDEDGPVFYVRLDCETSVNHPITQSPDTVRVHIQFDERIPLRTLRTLKQGFEVVKDRCRVAGARRMVFDSLSPHLRTFCRRRFGFRDVPGTADLELELEPIELRQPKFSIAKTQNLCKPSLG